MTETTPFRQGLALAAIAAAAFILYVFVTWPALSGPFVFDDFPNLSALAKHGPIDSWRKLGLFLSESRDFPGRPLSMLSFLSQRADWPDNPFPFKLINLCLHLCNSLLVFALFKRAAASGLGLSAAAARLASALAAIAWMAHPMQLSTVMLTVQRMTLLSSFFVLLGLLVYAKAITSPALGVANRGVRAAIGILLFGALAALCKESGLLIAFYALALDMTLFRAQVRDLPASLRRMRLLALAPFVALVLGYFLLQVPHLFQPIAYRDFSLGERVLTESRVLWDYVLKTAVPNYASYGVYHDDFTVSRGLLSPWTTLAAVLGLIAVVWAACAQRDKRPLLAFAVAWFLGGHLMEAGPIPLELYFEHRNYLPMAGPLFAIVGAVTAIGDAGRRRLAFVGMGLWFAACVMATALYAQLWSDPAKLAYFWAASHPASPRAQGDYAQMLFRLGDLPKAREVLLAAAARRPDEPGIELEVLYIDCALGRLNADTVSRVRATMATSPWSRLSFQTMDQLRLLAQAKRCPALDEAAWLGLSDALLANPSFQSEGVAMGNLHYQRHALYVSRGDLSGALEELERTAEFDPDPEIVRLQAKYLADAGLRDKAIETLRAYDPSHRPLLRRLLVDDAAINSEAAAVIAKGAVGASAK
jgi:protein O-mannosyl-transferase